MSAVGEGTIREVTLRQAEALVGLPYVAGSFDCMHFAVQVQRELFGREVRWHGRHPGGRATQAAAIARHCDACAKAIERGAVISGDVLLAYGEVEGGRQYHVGTVILHLAEIWLLHLGEAWGSSTLQPLPEALYAGGLHVEGWYRWL